MLVPLLVQRRADQLRRPLHRVVDTEGPARHEAMDVPYEESLEEGVGVEEALFGIERLNVPRSDIPAVTHVDYSARVQTVHRETNLRYHELISAFKERTGCPVLVNTSFNVRDEPIVCTPGDAYRCFMATEMDVLVVGDTVLFKEEQ